MADIICCDHLLHLQSEELGLKRRRSTRMDNNNNNIRGKFKFVTDHVAESSSSSSSSLVLVASPGKRQKLELELELELELDLDLTTTPMLLLKSCLDSNETTTTTETETETTKGASTSSLGSEDEVPEHESSLDGGCPNFSFTNVCGRRREMEDSVAVHPSFWTKDSTSSFHFFGVYDGHGCSHVAVNCKDRMHHLVKEELEKKKNNNNNRGSEQEEWKEVMERSFDRMDKQVLQENIITCIENLKSCKCQLRMPQCDAVGSTAVVSVVTPDKVVVANCGDSRAILARDGKAIPLSVDHKPDLPEELNRIEEAGGRVIYWDGPRVLGVLAMSRAIGDNYLKPYVSSVPEITVTERSEEDEFLIMASDGLWDVVSNDTACGIVRMCLSDKCPAKDVGRMCEEEKVVDKRCSDAAILLTKLALARRTGDNVSVVVVDLRREEKKIEGVL